MKDFFGAIIMYFLAVLVLFILVIAGLIGAIFRKNGHLEDCKRVDLTSEEYNMPVSKTEKCLNALCFVLRGFKKE